MRSRKKDGALKPPRKIDRRSSRGVMFENEGLRLRTIEINAEVERGQSDLRKLKRENETLKQQVWTLRDEYDKLESVVRDFEGTDDNETEDTEDAEHDETSQPPILESLESKTIEESRGVSKDSVPLMYQSHAKTSSYAPNNLCENNPQSIHPCLVEMKSVPDVSIHPMKQSSEDPPVSKESTAISDDHNDESLVSHGSHFNLDQLLDFASSFHYDRRKHCSDEDQTNTSLTNESNRLTDDCQADDLSRKHPSYSSMRRRSSTVIEKVKSSSNTGAVVKEVKHVSLCKDAIPTSSSDSQCLQSSGQTTTVTYTKSSYYFAGSLDGRSQSLGTGLNTAATIRTPGTPVGPLYSSTSATNIAAGTTSSLGPGLPLVSVFSHRTSSLVRLSSIEPNTLMVSIMEIPQLWDITTQEVIDELEQHNTNIMPDIRGVRVAGRAAYISLGHRETLESLIDCGFTLRGLTVTLIDITRESTVLSLTGVPHYIADGTLSILLSAFGVIIGEIERRFYKGVDTGERFVRMQVKNHVKLPKYVTVGGCRIVLGIENPEVPPPNLIDWSHIECPGPILTPHSSTLREVTKELPKNASTDYDHSSDQSLVDRIPDKSPPKDKLFGFPHRPESNLRPIERKDSIASTKTFSSRCVLNVKLPERPVPTGLSRVSHRDAPLPPHKENSVVDSTGIIIGQTSSINAGHVLRAAALGASSRSTADERKLTSPPNSNNHSPIAIRRGRSPRESLLKEGSRSNSRSSSVVGFDDNSSDGSRTPQLPPNMKCTPLLANGILRKPSIIPTSEQETLLPHPSQIPLTATIRNRLRLGRSASCDPSKPKEKKKKRISRMESISENTLNDDSTDVTPLGTSRTTSRRDSEKSSTSGSNDKGRKEAIDLPWCGCWGNGCF